MSLDQLKGKTVSIFMLDGNAVSGEVIGVTPNEIYISMNETKARMVVRSSIASISMDTVDAKQAMAIKKATVTSKPPNL